MAVISREWRSKCFWIVIWSAIVEKPPELARIKATQGSTGTLERAHGSFDVWSLGVILFELVNGQIQIPKGYKGDTGDFVRNRVMDSQKQPVFSKTLADLICRILDPNPSARIDTAGMLAHKWMTTVK